MSASPRAAGGTRSVPTFPPLLLSAPARQTGPRASLSEGPVGRSDPPQGSPNNPVRAGMRDVPGCPALADRIQGLNVPSPPERRAADPSLGASASPGRHRSCGREYAPAPPCPHRNRRLASRVRSQTLPSPAFSHASSLSATTRTTRYPSAARRATFAQTRWTPASLRLGRARLASSTATVSSFRSQPSFESFTTDTDASTLACSQTNARRRPTSPSSSHRLTSMAPSA